MPSSSSPPPISPSDYTDSPIHRAVALADLPLLTRILSPLPRPLPPSLILTPDDAALQSHLFTATLSPLLDLRHPTSRDTPLHLAVRLDLPSHAALLLSSGADPSLHNAAGWTPLQEALVLRRRRLVPLLLRHHRISAHSKFRRRLFPLLAALRRLPDFYFELSFRFESSLLPFLHRAAPSDTYRIWKRGDCLRADTSLAGFDGLRVRRADQSFLFLGSGGPHPGALIVLDRARRQVHDAFADDYDDHDSDIDELIADASAYRPGLNITAAELVPRTNWRGRNKTENVADCWKARVYDIDNVVFSFKSMHAVAGDDDHIVVPLELTEDEEEGFLVAELPEMPRRSCCELRQGRSGDVELDFGSPPPPRRGRRSLDVPPRRLPDKASKWEREVGKRKVAGKRKEKEMVKSLRPTVWLTEDFPLNTEEFLPLLDILANKVKAVRRLRELLTTKFPPGTFPVKLAIPIVPTVKVVVTFTKFVNLQPTEQFFTPYSSPRHLSLPGEKDEEEEEEEGSKAENMTRKSSWMKWNSPTTTKIAVPQSKSINSSQVVDNVDPFTIPSDYTWVCTNSNNQRTKKSRSRKGKPNQVRTVRSPG